MLKKEPLFPALLIILFGLSLYLNVIDGKFIWDDELLLTKNAYVTGKTGFARIFAEDIGAGAGAKFNYYRPLQLSSYRIEYAFWGFNQRGYHLTNIALHLLAAVCVFYLALLLSADRTLAFLAGLIFVSHPVQTETVAYISNRGDLLCALFFMAAFILYIKYTERRSTALYLLMTISYLLSLFSKENALMFIGVIAIYHYAFREKLKARRLFPLLAVTAAYLLLRGAALKTVFSGIPDVRAAFFRLPEFFGAIATYLRLLLFPFGLHFDYGNKTFGFNDPVVILGMILVFLLIIYALINRKKNAAALFSVFWFLAMLLPVSNVYPATAFYMAEHHLYIPLAGFAFLLASLLTKLYRQDAFRVPAACVIAAMLIFYAYSTVRQNNYWLEPIDFYLRTIGFTPDSAAAHYNLGKEYEKTGDEGAAVLMYKQALESDPGYEKACNNLGIIYSRHNNKEKALAMFSRALEINPESCQASTNLGILYYELGRKDEAFAFLRKATEINPDDPAAWYNLAVAHLLNRDYGAAARYCDKAMDLGYKPSREFLSRLRPRRE